MPDPIRDTVDGVPVWHRSNDSGLLRASLLFRWGMADETLPTSGWTHLLEHLALHGPRAPHIQVNGSVGLVQTSFDVAARAEDVVSELGMICARIGRIDTREFDHERRVLAAESEKRGTPSLAQALLWRYGAQGPGLAGYSEPGLARATPEGLTALARHVFARQNAVLVLDGPVPPGLRLELPDGERRPLPALIPCPQPYPSAYAHFGPEVLLTAEIERSTTAIATARILGRRVTEGLRHERAVAYSPWARYERMGTRALVSIGTDAATEHVGTAVADLLGAVSAMADQGPTSAEVEEDRAAAHQWQQDPLAAPSAIWSAAEDELFGREPLLPSALRAAVDSVDEEAVRAAARQLRSSLMLGVPVGTAHAVTTLPWLDNHRDSPELFAPTRHTRRRDITTALLERGQEGLRYSEGLTVLEVRYADLAGVLALPDGARRLIRPDGYSVVIEPTLWNHGEQIVADIDRHVPPDRVMPQPARNPEHIPKAPTLWVWLRAWLTTNQNGLLIIAACLGIVVVLLNVSASWQRILGPAAVLVLFAWWQHRRE